MNNQGFAITGIIYTLFILFLVILLSVLSGLSISQRMFANSLEGLEKNLEEVRIIDNEYEIYNIDKKGIATYYGKYIFKVDNSNKYCISYMNQGTKYRDYDIYDNNDNEDDAADNYHDNLIFTTKDCTNDLAKKLVKIYVFEGWN